VNVLHLCSTRFEALFIISLMYRKIKNPFPLAFRSIDSRGVRICFWSGGWEAENRTFLEHNEGGLEFPRP
jgi:hypothetical protein